MGNSPSTARQKFLDSEEAVYIREQLEQLVSNPDYSTRTFYTPLQAENISFVEKHLTYLAEHPKLDVNGYLSNLRLMTKLRNNRK